MTDHNVDHARRAAHDDRTDQPYACIRTGGGEYIIYDQKQPTAWIQSDTVNAVAECK